VPYTGLGIADRLSREMRKVYVKNYMECNIKANMQSAIALTNPAREK
jgi:hypothetical protein